jgi:Helix-turn-helix domain
MTTKATNPHIRIDLDFIREYVPLIGPYGYTIFSVIKAHENGKTGDCFPSYKTIARESKVDRSTVIRYVKKLRELHLISPEWRFKEDGSYNSNQYNFDKGGRAKPPTVVAQDNPPSSPPPPKLSEENQKEKRTKQRTLEEVDLMPTERQKTCPHPPSEIVILPDNITICHHCYGLLDENLTLQEEETPIQSGELVTVEIVAA